MSAPEQQIAKEPVTPRRSYRLRAATVEDAPTIEHIRCTAFAAVPNGLQEILWPTSTSPEVLPLYIKSMTARTASDMRNATRPNGNVFNWVLAEDTETDEAVAMGKWEIVTEHGSTDGVKKEETLAAGGAAMPASEARRWDGPTNEKLLKEFFGRLEDRHEALMRHRGRHYYVHLLCTSPSHQGKGAISTIIRHILALADRDGVPSYIEASPSGRPVYLKFGWEVKEGFTIMNAYQTDLMVREPKKPSEELLSQH